LNWVLAKKALEHKHIRLNRKLEEKWGYSLSTTSATVSPDLSASDKTLLAISIFFESKHTAAINPP
jgi:hypothetical protein